MSQPIYVALGAIVHNVSLAGIFVYSTAGADDLNNLYVHAKKHKKVLSTCVADRSMIYNHQ